MKNLINILLVTIAMSLSGYVAAGKCPDGSNSPKCQYPGYTPDWTSRYNVSCEMRDADGKQVRASFTEGGVDYAQAGALMLELNAGVINWYERIRDAAIEDGADVRLVPEVDTRIQELVDIMTGVN